jgi:hypothetical protein
VFSWTSRAGAVTFRTPLIQSDLMTKQTTTPLNFAVMMIGGAVLGGALICAATLASFGISEPLGLHGSEVFLAYVAGAGCLYVGGGSIVAGYWRSRKR